MTRKAPNDTAESLESHFLYTLLAIGRRIEVEVQIMNRFRKWVELSGLWIAKSIIVSIAMIFLAANRMDALPPGHPAYFYYGFLSVLLPFVFGICALITGIGGTLLHDHRAAESGYATFAISLILFFIAVLVSMRDVKFSLHEHHQEHLAMHIYQGAPDDE